MAKRRKKSEPAPPAFPDWVRTEDQRRSYLRGWRQVAAALERERAGS